MSKHDQAALDAATQIIDLFSSPGQWRDTWHLKHKVQCLLIDLLERNATQPAAGELVARYRERSNHDVIRRDESQPCFCWAESDHRIGQEVAAPPAAAHGDDTRRIDWLACMWRLGGTLPDVDHGSFREAIDVAMRAQGDGEVQ